MADALLTDVLKQLGSIAAQQAQHEIKLIVGVDEEVKNLQNSFTMVQAMLNNAEERQFMDSAVKLWFGQLKDAYYMMDDVLDSRNTARTKSQIQTEEAAADSNTLALKKKVCPFYPSLPCCFRQADNLSLHHEISHKIEKLNETLDKILSDKGKYGFDLSRQIPVQVQRPKTTSDDVVESDITGRNKDIDELLHNLFEKGSQEDRKPFVISLVGMGGIGKSTLAQLAYNHHEVLSHFQIRMWVCIFDPFDQCKVVKAIIQEINPKHKYLNKINEFQTLLHEMTPKSGSHSKTFSNVVLKPIEF